MKHPTLLLVLAAVASIDGGANRATQRATRRGRVKDAVLPDRYVSVGLAARYLGVDPMTVRNMLKDGRLQAYTLGHRVLRIRLSDIDKALQPYGGATDVTN